MTVSGLEGQETSRTWNGTGSGEASRSQHTDEHGDRSYDMSSTSVIEDVVRALPREENPWPLSGTITRTISVVIVNGPDGDVTREITAVLTFNGMQFVIMTVNGEDFEVDLAARESDRGVRRKRD